MLNQGQKAEIMKEIAILLTDWPEKIVTESKKDSSPVTQYDVSISDYLENYFKKNFETFTVISEENETRSLDEQVVIIDPIDGTGGFSHGGNEWVVSIASINHGQNWGWIFNPLTGYSISSDEVICEKKNSSKKLRILVSRSEWKKVLSKVKFSDSIELVPMGSAAYKLALIATEGYDASITFRDKSLWDIWGGVAILNKAKIFCYENNQRVFEGNKIKFGPIIYWCRPEAKKLIEQEVIKKVKEDKYEF